MTSMLFLRSESLNVLNLITNIFNISLLKLDTLTETALEQGHEVHWQPTTWLVFTAPTPQPETRLGLRSESSHNISLFPSVIPVSWKLKNQKPLPSEFSQRRSWTLVPQEIEIFQVCEPFISASGHIKKKTQILANKTAGNLRFLDKRNNDQISWKFFHRFTDFLHISQELMWQWTNKLDLVPELDSLLSSDPSRLYFLLLRETRRQVSGCLLSLYIQSRWQKRGQEVGFWCHTEMGTKCKHAKRFYSPRGNQATRRQGVGRKKKKKPTKQQPVL